MLNKNFAKPPKRLTAQQWAEQQLAEGNVYAFDYTPEQLEMMKKAGKAPTFYNPKKFSKNGTGFTPLEGVTETDPNIVWGGKQTQQVTKQTEPKPMPVEGRKPMEFGPYQNLDPNTGKYYDPTSGQEIQPIVEGKKKGGLVKKYDLGGMVQMGAETQKLTSGLAGPLSAVGTTAATAIQANNLPNEQGEVDENKAALAGGLKWASTAAPIAANPALLAATGGLSALAIPVAGGIGAIVAARKAGQGNDEAVKQFKEKQIEEAKAKSKSSMDNAIRQRDLGYSKGGKIVGQGTGTSDGITAKVREGSFIVPAKNAEVAEELREKVLRKAPSKKAALKQSGGVDVKLSNGEHMFTPEEVNELKAQGIDVESLAPEARHELAEQMKCGGSVKGYGGGGTVTGDEDKIIAEEKKKIAEYEKKISELDAANKAAIAKANRDKARGEERSDIIEALEKRADDLEKAKKEFAKSKAEFNAIDSSIQNYKSQTKSARSAPQSAGEKAGLFGSSRPSDDDILKNTKKLVSELEKKRAAIQKSQKDIDYASDEKNYLPKTATSKVAKESTATVKPYTAGGEQVDLSRPKETKTATLLPNPEANPSPKPIRKAPPKTAAVVKDKMDIEPITDIKDLSLRELEGVNQPSYNDMAAKSAEEQLAAKQAAGQPTTPTLDAAGNKTTQSPQGSSMNWQNGLNQALGYGIPAIQAGIGASALSKLGKRPIDKLDADYLASIEQAKARSLQAEKEAQYGMTAEEKFLLGQENQGLLNQARAAARNYSGGSGTTAFQQERMGINDAFGRGLLTKVRDNALKLQKQGIAADRAAYADQLIAGKTDMNRRLFNDTLTNWKENQQAAGNLTAQGLTNLVSQNRYNQFLQNRDAYQ